MRTWFSPRRAIWGSVTPHWSTRLRMVFTAWSTAWERVLSRNFGLNARVKSPAVAGGDHVPVVVHHHGLELAELAGRELEVQQGFFRSGSMEVMVTFFSLA